MDKPLDLDTASGIVQATHEATVYVIELGIKVTALVMPDSPPLLSVGLLVKDLGMTFAFDRDGAVLTRKNGVRIYCADMHNVPVITPCKSIYKKNATPVTTSYFKRHSRRGSTGAAHRGGSTGAAHRGG